MNVECDCFVEFEIVGDVVYFGFGMMIVVDGFYVEVFFEVMREL